VPLQRGFKHRRQLFELSAVGDDLLACHKPLFCHASPQIGILDA
jgi:hypothetical protein